MVGKNQFLKPPARATGQCLVAQFAPRLPQGFAALALVFCSLQASLYIAQAQPFAPSSLGHILDVQSKRMRPIYGFPGAAFFGDPAGPEVEQLSLSPDGRWVVYSVSGEGRLALVANPTEVLQVFPKPLQVKWSADASSVVIEESLLSEQEAASASTLRVYLLDAAEGSTSMQWRKVWNGKLSFSSVRILAAHAKRQEFWFRAADATAEQGSLYRYDWVADQAELVAPPGRYTALVYANPASASSPVKILVADAGQNLILELLRLGDSWSRSDVRLELPAATTLADLYLLPGGIAVLWNSQDPAIPAKLGNYRWQDGQLLAASTSLIDLDTPSAVLAPLAHPSLLLLQQTRSGSELSFAIYDAAREQVFFLPAPFSAPASGSNVSGGQN